MIRPSPTLHPTLVGLTRGNARKWRPFVNSTVMCIEDGALAVRGRRHQSFRYGLAGDGVTGFTPAAALGFCKTSGLRASRSGSRSGYLFVTEVQVRDIWGNVLLRVPGGAFHISTGSSTGVWDRGEVADFARAADLEFFEEEHDMRMGPVRKSHGQAVLPGASMFWTFLLPVSTLVLGLFLAASLAQGR